MDFEELFPAHTDIIHDIGCRIVLFSFVVLKIWLLFSIVFDFYGKRFASSSDRNIRIWSMGKLYVFP